MNVLGCDCYASYLEILVDLAFKQYFFVEAILIFCSVANWLDEIAKTSSIVFRENRFIFREFSIVTLCIGYFFADEERSLSFSSINKSHS